MKRSFIFLLFLIKTVFPAENMIINKILSFTDSMKFQVVDSSKLKISQYEISQFATREIYQFSFKSRNPMEHYPEYYMRFKTLIYVLPDSSLAKRRYNSIVKKPTGLLPEEQKTWPLRRYIRIENIIIVLKTDVALFEKKLEQIHKSLGSYLQ